MPSSYSSTAYASTAFVALIPARMASTRLPGKPLADLAGLPMVVRVAQRAQASGAQRVVVATDSDEIVRACQRHGIETVLTLGTHPTGTDRLSEAVEHLKLSEDTLVVNVQGDEPLIPPEVIAAVAHELDRHPDCQIATAAHALRDADECFNPDVVKVVTDVLGRALYFSRAPIPWSRDQFQASPKALPPEGLWLRHVGLYAYRIPFLRQFPKLTHAPLETLEQLEQLRALWHGNKIAVLQLAQPLPPGVDSAQDLARMRALIQQHTTHPGETS